jgi:hypothetical protein
VFTDAAAPVVAQLTQLRRLLWATSDWLTDEGLEQLARLDMAYLYLSECGLSDEVLVPEFGFMDLTHKPEMVSVAGRQHAQQPLTVVLLGKLFRSA